MAKNMKFHAIAIGVISLIIIILYMLIGPTTADTGTQKPTDRYARIGSATWGLACNTQIEEATRVRESIPLAKTADGKVVQTEALKKVMVDNVLPVVKKACEGQIACQVQATDDSLGVPLLPGCYKQLNVNYRCSDFDRLTMANIEQGQSLKIDCTANAPAAAPHRP